MSNFKTFNDFLKKNSYKKDSSEWEKMKVIVENVKEQDINELFEMLNENKETNIQKFAYIFEFTLKDLEDNKLVKTETSIHDSNKNKEYFESATKIAKEIVEKIYSEQKDLNKTKMNEKCKFFEYSINTKEWKFTIYANNQEEIASMIKDIFEAMN